MYSLEAFGLSLTASSQHNRNYESIYARREQSLTASLMSGRCAENITVLFTCVKKTQVLQRLSALSVSASGHQQIH